MKRKYDHSVGFEENPSKFLLASQNDVMYNVAVENYVVETSPLGRPVLASTPVANGNGHVNGSAFNRRHHAQPTSRSFNAPRPRSPPTPTRNDGELRRVIDNFVTVYEQLDRTDEPHEKPNYSYTELAFLALLRAPNFCLPITEIYRYVQSRFLFYKHSTRKHWKNAIRHSLAKTLCFTKIPVGRGASNNDRLSRSTYLWCVIPSSIACFARGDYRPIREGDKSADTLRWGFYQANAEAFWLDVGDFMATKMAVFKRLVHDSHNPGLILEAQVCMMSDDVIRHDNDVRHDVTSGSRKPLVERNIEAALNACQSTVTSCQFQMPKSTTNAPGYQNCGQRPTQETVASFDNLFPMSVHTGTTACAEVDPWLSLPPLQSPEINGNFMEQHRRTPPCSNVETYDSGFETCESSPNESSCRMFSSCSGNNFASPSLAHENFNSSILSDDCMSDLKRLDMSPFSLSDFSDAGPNVSDPSGFHGNFAENSPRQTEPQCSMFQFENHHLTSQRGSYPQALNIQSPLAHEYIPLSNEMPRKEFEVVAPEVDRQACSVSPQVTETQFRTSSHQQISSTYSQQFQFEPTVSQQNWPTRMSTSNRPIYVLNPDGTLSSAYVAQWSH